MALSIFLLPGMVVVIIPWILLFLDFITEPALFDLPIFLIIRLFFGLFFGSLGTCLLAWTIYLFYRKGSGTIAPTHPPKNLVTEGPYCIIRNPMLEGVFLILASISLITVSLEIFSWLLLFLAGNLIYIHLIEEKMLSVKFGEEYELYKEKVPAWIPKQLRCKNNEEIPNG